MKNESHTPEPRLPNNQEGPEKDNESRLFTPRNFLLAAGAILALILVAVGASAILFALIPTGTSPLPTGIPPSEPRLEVAPANDFQSLRSTQEADLNSYGWVNQNAGIVHIPIDKAMGIIAERGLPLESANTGQPGQTANPAPQATASGSEAGAILFQDLGCSGCHGEINSSVAPTLHGVFGSQVTLDNGQALTADENYLHELIRMPQAKIVKGYQPIMPDFSGRITDEQLSDLIAYIESLAGK